MLQLCIGDLARLVDGNLTLGSLPPLAGIFEPVRRVVVDSREVLGGDVYWGLATPEFDGGRLAEEAFVRGALGVVVTQRHVEPWAGRFSIAVADANTALQELAARLPRRMRRRNRGDKEMNSTQMVRAMLEGQPVSLNKVIDRLAWDAASFAC